MQTAKTGNENNDQKVPAGQGADGGGGSPAPEVKGPTATELAVALNETDLALQKAQDEIVRLKREGTKSGDPTANNEQITELNKTITDLQADIELLKKGAISKETADALSTEITSVRKRNKDLADALVSHRTTGDGANRSANQDQPNLPEKKVERTPQEQAVIDRMRSRRISEGRDPETGLKK